MPTYEYRCATCEKITELKRPVEDRNKPIECECGSDAVKIISRTSEPQFNASGFTPKFH